MIYLLVIIVALVILSKLSSLSTSIKILQSEVLELKKQKPSSIVHAENASTPAAGTAPAVPLNINELNRVANQTVQTLKVSPIAAEEDPIEKWFKENLLLKIGVLMILAGFGWFVSYAFIHNWIGPVGRITIGFVAGAMIAIFGTIRLPKNEVQGNMFTILGSALIIITALAGQYYYDFFTPFMVLGIAFLVSVYVSLVALGYSKEKIAIYGLLISLTAPLFSHTSSMDPVVLYFYLAVISLASIWLAVGKGWRTIIPIGITGILLYSVPMIMGGSSLLLDSKYIVLTLIYLISIFYLVISVWSLIRQKEKASTEDVYITLVNTMLILGTTIHIVPTVYQSLIIAGWMLVYAFSGFFVFQKTKNEKLFYIHALISILLLAIATSIELSGPTLVIALTIEAAIISAASYVVTNKMEIAQQFGLLLVGPVFMSLSSFSSAKWESGILHSDFAVLFIMAIILTALGFLYGLRKTEDTSDFEPHHFSFIAATVYIYALIWLCAHYLVSSADTAVFASLFIYTIIGLATHFTGLFNGNAVLKNYGKVLLIVVVARLLLIDVWKMELALRVVTFIVLGVMFISTAFISKKKSPAPVISN